MVKSIVLSASQSLIRLGLALVSIKIVAVYLGPSGMALYAQLQSLLQLNTAVLSSAVSSGLVKEISADGEKEQDIIAAALNILVCKALFLFILMIFLSGFLSHAVLQGRFRFVLILIPVAALFSSFISFLMSLFNGKKQYNAFFWCSSISAIFLTMCTVILSFSYGWQGALKSVVFSPIISGVLIALWWFLLSGNIRFRWRRASSAVARRLLGFSGSALIASVSVYASHMLLREYISRTDSLELAGVWYSATRLSEVYMGVVAVVFSAVLIPTYSEKKGLALLATVKRWNVYTLAIGLGLVMSVWTLGNFGVLLVYGAEFAAASSFLKVYVIGDVLKIAGWVYIYLLIVQGEYKLYCFLEVFSSVTFFLCVSLFFTFMGAASAPVGYIVQSLLSLAITVILCKNRVAKI